MCGKMSIRNATLLLGILLQACSPGTEAQLPYYNTPDFTPHWIDSDERPGEKISHRIENFSLLDQEGKTITQETIAGKIHVANFFFTSCPGICLRMADNFETIQEEFGADPEVVLLSFSVTPWMDSIARLKEYAEQHAIKPDKWHLLTGSKAAIYDLARTSYFAEEDQGFTKDSTEFLHTENFILVDKDRRIRGIYKGTLALDTEKLIGDIRLLLEE